MNNRRKPNVQQTIARLLLGLMLVFTGTAHLTWLRSEFLAQVPQWVPLDADLVVLLSGVAELILGISLLLPGSLRLKGWITALFFLLIFPGNIAQFINHTDAFGLNSDLSRGIRLLFQPVLIVWALWCTSTPKRR